MLIEKRVPSFDPRASSDSAAERFRQLVFNGLTRKGGNFEPIPDLAESFECSPDNKVFTFKLRDKIKFHDGRSFSSLDVKYTFETMLKDKSLIKGASFDQDLSAIEVVDPLTIRFHCRNPFPSLPNDLIAVGIIPEGTSGQQAKLPVGTGPFKFDSYIEEQEIVLKANDQYFEGRPAFDRLRIKIVPDNSTREGELRKGSADLAINADLDPVTIESLQKASGLKVIIIDGTNLAHLGINLLDPILKDQRVRQAIAYAIDRETIIREVFRGQAKPAASLLPVTQWAYEQSTHAYTHDVARATQLLDEAGYISVNGQPRLKLTLKTSTLSIARKVGEILQAQLKQAGISLDLQSLERQKLTQDMTDGNFQLYYNIMVGGNQSTDMFRFVYHSRSIPPNGQNRSRYKNPQVDKLIDEAQTATRERRQQIFSQIQKTLADELPQIYLWYQSGVIVESERLSEIKPDPSGDWRIVSQLKILK
ncbi:MAG: ABC transporter substrate-binding protein [Acidobacteria bacterium]|nr:ABC transporter substrate-binding protein [Acidobacteriota bacterium]